MYIKTKNEHENEQIRTKWNSKRICSLYYRFYLPSTGDIFFLSAPQ